MGPSRIHTKEEVNHRPKQVKLVKENRTQKKFTTKPVKAKARNSTKHKEPEETKEEMAFGQNADEGTSEGTTNN